LIGVRVSFSNTVDRMNNPMHIGAK